MTSPTLTDPPAGVVLRLAEQLRDTMTAAALADPDRGESQGTWAPMWRRAWLAAQVWEMDTDDAASRQQAADQMVAELVLILQLFGQDTPVEASDPLVANAARRLFFVLTGRVRPNTEDLFLAATGTRL